MTNLVEERLWLIGQIEAKGCPLQQKARRQKAGSNYRAKDSAAKATAAEKDRVLEVALIGRDHVLARTRGGRPARQKRPSSVRNQLNFPSDFVESTAPPSCLQPGSKVRPSVFFLSETANSGLCNGYMRFLWSQHS